MEKESLEETHHWERGVTFSSDSRIRKLVKIGGNIISSISDKKTGSSLTKLFKYKKKQKRFEVLVLIVL